jgi:hypothetical protein
MGNTRKSTDDDGNRVIDWESQNGEVTHTKIIDGERKGEHTGYDRTTGRSFYAGHNYTRVGDSDNSADDSNDSDK